MHKTYTLILEEKSIPNILILKTLSNGVLLYKYI